MSPALQTARFGEGPWSGAWNHVKENEESTALGLVTKTLPSLTSCIPPHLHSVSSIHTHIAVFTHPVTSSGTQLPCVTYLVTRTLYHQWPVVMRGITLQNAGVSEEVMDRTEASSPALIRCCPQMQCVLQFAYYYYVHMVVDSHLCTYTWRSLS